MSNESVEPLKEMSFPFYIARRLSLSGNGHKSAPAIKVAVLAVALSVAVMLISIAVVNGFKNAITKKVVGFNSHLSMYLDTGEYDDADNLLRLTPTLKHILDNEPYITGYGIESTVPAIFKTESDFKGIYYKALSDASERFIRENLEEGEMPVYDKNGDNNTEVVVSRIAADQLQLQLGDTIDTYFISNDVRVRPLVIKGIYNSHFDNYDDVFAYGTASLISEVTPLEEGEGTIIKIQTDDHRRMEEYRQRLQARMAQGLADGEVYRAYGVESAQRAGAQYFSWLSLLDTNVVVILVLMAVVSCVTLIGGMMIIILDKMRFIGVMKSLGATNGKISRIFVYLSLRVAAIGMLLGNILALLLIWLQRTTHWAHLDPEAYYIDYVPVELQASDFVWLNLTVLTLIFLVLLLPSRYVSRISPSKTLRFE